MANKQANICGFLSSTTGTGSTIAVGSAITGLLTPTQAGISNGDAVSYSIKDGSSTEVGTAVYSSTGPSLTSRTPVNSTNSNAAINLSGAQEVRLTALAADLTPSGIGALAKASNLSDLASSTTALTNLGGTTVGKAVFAATDAAAARSAIGAPELAAQSDQETATSTSTFVSPGRQQYHPSAAKAWVNFNGTGTVAIRRGYNVSSITDNGTGNYAVNFTTSFATNDYATASMIQNPSSAGYVRLFESASYGTGITVSSVGVQTVNGTGTALQDMLAVCVMCLGDQ